MDHQGLQFKATDKRNMTSKALIAEIEGLYRQNRDSKSKETSPKYQYEFMISSTERSSIFNDMKQLLMNYLEKGAHYSGSDFEQVMRFYDDLVFYFFGYLASDSPLKMGDGVDLDKLNGEERACIENSNHVLFGNNSFYLFFRFFQV